MKALRRHVKFWLYGLAGRFSYYGIEVYFPRWAPIFRVVCEQGRFEPEIVDRVIALARPGTVIFDVGANIGLMAIPVLQLQPTARVVSFEPSPSSLSYLRATARASGFGDRWIVSEKGLADAPGELDFVIGRPQDGLFEGFRSNDRVPNARTVRVPVSTVDDEWRAMGQPAVSAVKIDVEGAEGQVLDGARALMRAHRPALLIEWHEPYLRRFGTDPNRLVDVAQTHGYRIFSVPHGIPVTDVVGLQVQMMSCHNFVLLPEPASVARDD